MQSRTVLVAVLVLVTVGCSKKGPNGTAGGGSAFDQRWEQALAAQGAQPLYIEDDRGGGLMGNVLGTQQGTLAMASALAQSNKEGTARLPEKPDAEQVQRLVRQYLPGVKSCYTRISREGVSRSGKAIVSFQIAGNGRVQQLSVEAPAFEGTQLPSCISSQVGHWVFPASRKGMNSITYPLVFVGA